MRRGRRSMRSSREYTMNICTGVCRQRGMMPGWFFIAVCGLVWFSGCTAESDAPRYQVSGTVTYAGQPVPSGLVKFEPDLEKGGTGPGGYAPIKDGVYCTEEGVCAGPVKVSICGFDGIPLSDVEEGETVLEETSLFKDYPTQAEIKNEDTTLDFVVPQL